MGFIAHLNIQGLQTVFCEVRAEMLLRLLVRQHGDGNRYVVDCSGLYPLQVRVEDEGLRLVRRRAGAQKERHGGRDESLCKTGCLQGGWRQITSPVRCRVQGLHRPSAV